MLGLDLWIVAQPSGIKVHSIVTYGMSFYPLRLRRQDIKLYPEHCRLEIYLVVIHNTCNYDTLQTVYVAKTCCPVRFNSPAALGDLYVVYKLKSKGAPSLCVSLLPSL